MIKINELVHGGVYEVDARNFSVGVFDSTDNTFIGIRRKFTDEFLDREVHWDYDDKYGTAKPIKYIDILTDLSYNSIFEYLRGYYDNKKCNET